MKKILVLLIICLSITFLGGCENNTGSNNNNPIPPQDIVPPVDDTNPEYDNYLKELKEIVNTEKFKVFKRYNDFTDEEEQCIYLGNYPNREITNEDLINKLSAIEKTNKDGYIEFEGLEFAEVTVQNTYESLEIGKEEYENSTKYKIGETYYFLVEPILWKILSYDTNKKQAFLITSNIIDAKMFISDNSERTINNRKIYASNYEFSDIRKWCNDVFYKLAFDKYERDIIQLKEINNKFNEYIYYECDDRNTEDYVYIPSYKEITNPLYGFEPTGVFSYSRFSIPSNYASAKGVYTANEDPTIPDSGLYLLRGGPEFLKSFIYFTKFDGYSLNPYYVNSPSTGIRLCINITIDIE